MKTIVPVAAAVSVLCLGMVPAQAGSGSGSYQGVSITFSITPARFDGVGCAESTWTLDYQKPPNRGFEVSFGLRQAGSNNQIDGDYAMVSASDPNAGQLKGSICPYEYDAREGPFNSVVVLSVEDDDYNDLGKMQLNSSPVPAIKNPSRIRRLKASASPVTGWPVVRGRATAKTLTKGKIGASGTVKIYLKRKGGWRKVGEEAYLDDFGRFAVTVYRPLSSSRARRSGRAS